MRMEIKTKNLTVIEIRIKILRDLKGLTQSELAKELNISRTLINSWENGYTNISLKQIVRLSYYFKVPVDYILGLTTKFDRNIYEFKENLDIKYLGEHLKIIRKLERLSQEQFSKLVHIPRSTIGRYENSKSTLSSVDLKQICNTFGYSTDWCIGNTQECIKRKKKIQLPEEEINEFITL